MAVEAGTTSPNAVSPRLWTVFISGVVALSGLLSFWGLGRQALWYDELFTAMATMHGPIAAVAATARDINPPLFYVLESLSLGMIGHSAWTLRVLPAALATLTTLTMYLAGKRLYGRATGAWAAVLYALSRPGLSYAQEARMYSLLMLLSALLLLAFALLLEKQTLWRTVLLGFVLSCIAYTHVYGYMAPAILATPVFLLPRLRVRVGRQVAVACAIAVVLFLPWIPVIPNQVAAIQAGSIAGSWWIRPPVSVLALLADDLASYAPGRHALGSLLFLALLAAGVLRPSASSPNRDARAGRDMDVSWTLLALATLPALLGLLISKYVVPIHSMRYTLGGLPAAILLVTRGGLNLRRPFGKTALTALLVVGALWLPTFYSDTAGKGDLGGAAEFVSQSPNSPVVTDGYYDAYSVAAYTTLGDMDRSAGIYYVPNGQAASLEVVSLDNAQRVETTRLTEESEDVFVLSGGDAESLARRLGLAQGRRLAQKRTFGGVTALRYAPLR